MINVRSNVDDYDRYSGAEGELQVFMTYVTDETIDKTEWYWGNAEWEEEMSNWEDEERLVLDLEIVHGLI
jgi:hypothetical protein